MQVTRSVQYFRLWCLAERGEPCNLDCEIMDSKYPQGWLSAIRNKRDPNVVLYPSKRRSTFSRLGYATEMHVYYRPLKAGWPIINRSIESVNWSSVRNFRWNLWLVTKFPTVPAARGPQESRNHGIRKCAATPSFANGGGFMVKISI